MYKYKLIVIADIVADTKKLNSFLGQGYNIQNSYVVNGNTAFYICKYENQNVRGQVFLGQENGITFDGGMAISSTELGTVNNSRW